MLRTVTGKLSRLAERLCAASERLHAFWRILTAVRHPRPVNLRVGPGSRSSFQRKCRTARSSFQRKCGTESTIGLLLLARS